MIQVSPGRVASCFFFSSRRRHTRCSRDWSSDVCSSDLQRQEEARKSTEVQRQAQAQERGKTARKVDSGRDHIRGEASAEVSLIEDSDFECPFCKSFQRTPIALMGRYAGRIH